MLMNNSNGQIYFLGLRITMCESYSIDVEAFCSQSVIELVVYLFTSAGIQRSLVRTWNLLVS